MCSRRGNDLLDHFSPLDLGEIVQTTAKSPEDPFDSYRPPKEKCLKYNISSTWLKWRVGSTKINVQDTNASYEPLPPEICAKMQPKKKRYSHGAPPCWKFIDEIRKEQQEIKNKAGLEFNKNLKAFKQKQDRGYKRRTLESVQNLVGPEWFQELSPKQLKAVDELKSSIRRDIINRDIVNTCRCIASLGLVLRPNQKHIAKAMLNCGGSPVEFLLILYQVMNPKRTSYSLNDTLLLSAVVHLTMTQTLRELHVRIPSPPKIQEAPIAKLPKPKKVKYESPYLEPQTFSPRQQEVKAVSRKNRIQYPESPYFSYLETFEQEREEHEFKLENCTNELKSFYEEILEEMKVAKKFYETLPGASNKTKLITPSKVITAKDRIKHLKTKNHPLAKLQDILAIGLTTEETSESEGYSSSEETTTISCDRLDDEEEDEEDEPTYLVTGVRVNENFETVPIIGGVVPPRGCRCKIPCSKHLEEFLKERCNCAACADYLRGQNAIYNIGGVTETASHNLIPIITGTLPEKECDCITKYKHKVRSLEEVRRVTISKTKYVNCGMVISKVGPIFSVFGVVVKRPKVKTISARSYARKILQAKEKLSQYDVTFISNGVTITNTGPVYHLTTVTITKSQRDREYQKQLVKIKTTMRENLFVVGGITISKNLPIHHVMASLVKPKIEEKKFYISKDTLEFAIGGVVMTEDGPVYNLTRVCVTKRLASAWNGVEDFKKSIAEKAFGDTRYILGGVTVTRIGLVYNINSVLGIKDLDARFKKPRKPYTGMPRKVIPISPWIKPVVVEEEEDEDEEIKEGQVVNEDEEIEEEIQEENEQEVEHCRCRKALEKFLEDKCKCPKRRQETATYVIAGTRTTNSGHVIKLVQGVYEKQCSCMVDYKTKLEQLEQYKARIAARYNLKKQERKYVVGGVCMTPTGPVYGISGVRPPVKCPCEDLLLQQEKEATRLKYQPKKLNTGRTKFSICGVKAMPEENVYIISCALPSKPCKCEKLFEKFYCKHETCITLYEKFVDKVHEEMERAKLEAYSWSKTNEDEKSKNDTISAMSKETVVEKEGEVEEDRNVEETREVEEAREAEKEQESVTLKEEEDGKILEEQRLEIVNEEVEVEEEEEETENDEDSCCAVPYETVKEKCTCEELVKYIPRPLPALKLPVKPEDTRQVVVTKRLVVCREIPTKPRDFFAIMQKTLNSMAEDGFPLACLPESWKLPHFRLWMDMRCGKCWRYEDRHYFKALSKQYWSNNEKCFKPLWPKSLPISKRKANTLTWKHAKYVKKLLKDNSDEYYRRVKHQAVENARKFIAPAYDYIFPTKTFRDCLFAYMPAKEEDVLLFKIVKKHENKFNVKKYKCKC